MPTSMYRVVDPSTNNLVEEFPTATDNEVKTALQRSHEEFGSWSKADVAARVETLEHVAGLYDSRADELAKIISLEMGKPVTEGTAEVKLCRNIYQYFADHAKGFLEDEPLRASADDDRAYIRRRPVGSLLGIMPWNFPYYQVARFAAPNLALGNTILLKHAPQCPRSARAIEEIFKDAGLPNDAYINIYATEEQVANIIIPSSLNQGVSLTGSERAGSAVAAECGRNLKKIVLELGGSDPCVILDTKDVTSTAQTLFQTRMFNTGQACNSPKRMIIMDNIYNEFVNEITQQAKAYTPLDPRSESSRLRPLSSPAARDRFMEQVEATIEDGATVLAGGHAYDGPGSYVEPVVFTDVQKGKRGYYEEFFGPAFMLFRISDEQEAVELANDTPFGLGSAVFSDDMDRAQRVGEQIDSGMVFLNTPEDTREHLPFGGVKRSGVGRELGPLAMDEFVNKQLIYKKG